MSQACSKCGTQLQAGVLNGLCPVCLIDFSAGPVRSFGDFELLDEIARGGMGIVYRARQRSLDRVVALKLILSGQFASEQAKERFRIEARAAANLRHPNIVAVHEVGEQDGFQFYSMDYIPGQSLAEEVSEKPMSPDKAAQCVRQVAEAIEYAHRHGVLHRDLKPSNVLLDASGHPHVTDFGLAKTNNTDASLTVSGQMLGSPHYLPPEQAGGNTSAGGPWSDVYSLGAILYHLLTGRAPFLGQSVHDTLTQVLQKDPVAPRMLVPRVPRDLETICLKCLQKEPHRRYQSARELADELDRCLAGRPIRARPVSSAEKSWRWCRRQPAVASLAGTAVVLLAAGSLLVFSQWRHTEHQRRRAETSLEANRQLLYLGDMRSGFTSLAENELAPLRAALRNQIPAGSQTDLRGFEWRYLWARAYPEAAARLPERKGVAGACGFSPDGTILAVYYWDDTLRWWDVRTGRELRPAFSNASALGAFSQHGDEYVFGSRDGTINVCRLGTGEIAQKMKGVGELVAITPDGTMAVTIKGEEFLNVIDVASGKSTFSKPKVRRRSDISWAATVAIADDGRTLALSLPVKGAKPSLYAQTSVELYDLQTQTALPPVRHIAEVASLIFTKDGKTLITGWSDGSILLSGISSGDSRTLAGHKLPVTALALSPDGYTLASGSSDEMIQLWDLPSGALKPPIAQGPLGDIWSLAFSPDSQRLASGGRNTVMTIWDLLKTPVPENIDELSPEKAWGNFAFSPNSKLMAAVCKGDVLKVWQTDSLRLVATLDHISYVMAFSPDSSALLASDSRESPLWWKLEENKVVPLPERGMSGVLCADVSTDRRLGILGHNNGSLQLVDIQAGKDLAQWPAHEGGVLSVRFSDSSGKIISGGRDRSVAVWDASSHKRIAWSPGEHRGAVCGLAYSTAAGRIASGCGADMIKIWDPADLSRALASMPSHKGAITSLDFSRDGRTLASGSEDRTVRLFNVPSAQEVATLAMDSPVRLVVFAPDGNSLAIVTHSGRLRVLRAATFDRAETLAQALRQ